MKEKKIRLTTTKSNLEIFWISIISFIVNFMLIVFEFSLFLQHNIITTDDKIENEKL